MLNCNQIKDHGLTSENVYKLINTTYLDLEFASTTLNLNFANSYGNNLIRIHVYPGNNDVVLNTASIQSKMLLDSNTNLKILDIQLRHPEEQFGNIKEYILDVKLV